MRDGLTQAITGYDVQSKGLGDCDSNAWAVKGMVSDLRVWGYDGVRVVVVSDGEPAMSTVVRRLAAERAGETLIEESAP